MKMRSISNQLFLAFLAFLFLARGLGGVLNHTLPVRGQFCQGGQLGGGRNVTHLAAFQGGAGERLRDKAQRFRLGCASRRNLESSVGRFSINQSVR